MKKKEARNIAIDYLYNAGDSFYRMNSKVTIDDWGTLSEDGYTDDECTEIQKQIDYLTMKLLKLKKP